MNTSQNQQQQLENDSRFGRGQSNESIEILNDLASIADGRIKHVFNGSCPDEVEGHTVRDEDCPACQVLKRYDALA
jgi:hypothetical protein